MAKEVSGKVQTAFRFDAELLEANKRKSKSSTQKPK